MSLMRHRHEQAEPGTDGGAERRRVSFSQHTKKRDKRKEENISRNTSMSHCSQGHLNKEATAQIPTQTRHSSHTFLTFLLQSLQTFRCWKPRSHTHSNPDFNQSPIPGAHV